MRSSYPIIKYPTHIEHKLRNQQSVLIEIEEIDDGKFSKQLDRGVPPLPTPYHKYVLWGLYGIWGLILGAFTFKFLSVGVLTAAVHELIICPLNLLMPYSLYQ